MVFVFVLILMSDKEICYLFVCSVKYICYYERSLIMIFDLCWILLMVVFIFGIFFFSEGVFLFG